jgi:tetratricopeptide (TPR) repeat protein
MRVWLLGGVLALAVSPALAEVVPRNPPVAGSVITARGGEEMTLFQTAGWLPVDVSQNLLPGDVLRTNPNGTLAILFADQTQIRVGRNSTMVVKEMQPLGPARLELSAGSMWARASRGGSSLVVETPSAAATIRGTDWSLAVDAAGTTNLVVLEGAVELSNAQGSVLVNQGEAAVARIGEAPTKIILVEADEREQILLYGELRSAFSTLPTSDLTGPQERQARAAALARPAPSRSAEDWLLLAETGISYGGRSAVREALAGFRAATSTPYQQARAALVKATLAGQEGRWEDAARVFGQALPGLDRSRQATAAYGRWFARSLANPDRNEPPPDENLYADEPAAAIARAIVASFVEGQARAIEILREAEGRFPDEAALPAARAGYAFELDRREEFHEALARARALDPDNPAVLLASARYRADIESDLDGALAELQRSAEIAPGDDAIWNEIGTVQEGRNAVLEADRAYRRAVELNPENPAIRANYARFLLAQDQYDAAKRQVDVAVAIDPSSYPVLAAQGRYLFRTGRTQEALQALLAASAANPTYADALIGLAIASYQAGREEEAEQALDNADRYDPDDPTPPLIRAAIAIDNYEADRAIRNAQEALSRRQARGGEFGQLNANNQSGSYLGQALRFIELDDWGRYYGDRVFDPFTATSYFDEAAAGRVYPFVNETTLPAPDDFMSSGTTSFTSQIQGLLMEPLSAASRTRRNDLENRPFIETTLGAGFIDREGALGWTADATVQGFTMDPVPISTFVNASIARPESPRDNDEADLAGGLFFAGARPTLSDELLVFGTYVDLERGFPGFESSPLPEDRQDTKIANVGAGWTHTLGERNVVQFLAVDSHTEQVSHVDRYFGSDDYFIVGDTETVENEATLSASHLIGFGPFILRYGLDGTLQRTSSEYRDEYFFFNPLTGAYDDILIDEGRVDIDSKAGRLYADATWDVSDALKLEAGIHASAIETTFSEQSFLDPRIGAAWSPFENHWLRVAYRADTEMPSRFTLSPISTLGLTQLDSPLITGGHSHTIIGRWDAEWTSRFFTALEYQHPEVIDLTLDVPELIPPPSVEVADGRIERLTATANLWLGGGFGVFGAYAWTESENRTPGLRRGDDLPFLPEHSGRVGFSWVHPANVKLTVAQRFVGERTDNYRTVLDAFTTTDASLVWEPLDKRFEVGLQVLNAFDEDFELVDDIPGAGRTVIGTFRTRF